MLFLPFAVNVPLSVQSQAVSVCSEANQIDEKGTRGKFLQCLTEFATSTSLVTPSVYC